MVKVSVIIPVFNAEKTLVRCVGSVLSQDYDNFELLLIDDGSMDSSLAICKTYAHRCNKIRVFSKSNGGVSSARNLGIDNANGEWITFIDSDDFVESGYFDGIDSVAEDVVFHSYKKISNEICVQQLDVHSAFSKLTLKDILLRYNGNSLLRAPWAKFFKLSLVGNIRFPEDMKVGEDTFFLFSYIAKCNNFNVLQRSCYMVQVAESPDEVKYSMTVDYAANSLKHLMNVFELLANKFDLPRRLFIAYIGYFKRVSKIAWKENPKSWYRNKDIFVIYKYVWGDLALLQKTRYYLAKLLNR